MKKLTLALSLTTALASRLIAQVEILSPDFNLFGKTSGDYTAEWYQYIYSVSTNGDYFFPDASPLADKRVYFLQRTPNYFPSLGIQTYTVPDDVYLFFPILGYEWDNIDAVPPLAPAEMRDALRANLDAIIAVHASIDGVSLTNPLAYRTESPVFSVSLATADNYFSFFFGRPITGLVDPMVAGGYLIMVKPLPPGLHDVRTGYTIGGPDSLSRERHYQINAVRANHAPVADAGATIIRVISPDDLSARVVLDGSRSSDQDSDALTYSWAEGASTLGTEALSANFLSVRTHVITLIVSDGRLSATNSVTVEILTPCQALGELAGAVEAAHLAKKKAKHLVEELGEACSAFEHGFEHWHHDRKDHLKHASHELREFQHEVREELDRPNPALAALLIEGTQEIIDAVASPARAHHHGEGDEDDDDSR